MFECPKMNEFKKKTQFWVTNKIWKKLKEEWKDKIYTKKRNQYSSYYSLIHTCCLSALVSSDMKSPSNLCKNTSKWIFGLILCANAIVSTSFGSESS